MNKRITISVLLILVIVGLTAEKITFSGVNEFNFIYRDISEKYENSEESGDDYKSYFSDELKLQLSYRNFVLGAKYVYYKPEYDKMLQIENVGSEEDDNYFDEYFLQYSDNKFFALAGTYEAVIGSGIALHSFYDNDFNIDTRLLGGYGRYTSKIFQSQLFLGVMKNPEDEDENDQIVAFDFSTKMGYLKLSSAYVLQRINLLENSEDDYNNRNVVMLGSNYVTDSYDLKSELVFSKDDNNRGGRAIYLQSSAYLGKFTLTSAYNNYYNFAYAAGQQSKTYALSDLPSLNHSEDPLSDLYISGTDEENMMGEIRFNPTFEDELAINYSEGWSRNYYFRLANLFAEYRHEFETWTFKAEFEHLEQKSRNEWLKELTPALNFDFAIFDFPVFLLTEYQVVESENSQAFYRHFEPKIQTDISFGLFSVSAIIEHEYGDFDSGEKEFGDSDSFWIGTELSMTIIKTTDIRLFFGKEKEEKVCRNGVCKKQPKFSGLRLDITTTF
ncbi:MAG: hypothetical protein PHR06_13920 [Candidatus Cloacimonetes bacterium]|nr:hypothetical protein [Candidatus Cloacimonadota bacterium]